MMELLRQWLMGITCAALVVTLAEHMTPQGSMKKIVGLAGGLVLLVAVLSPIVRLDYQKLSGELAGYRMEAEGYAEAMKSVNSDLTKSIIAQQSGAYIVDKATALGIENCTVQVICTEGAGGLPLPVSVAVKGNFTTEQGAQLRRIIEADFAIPAAEQRLERSEVP
ncbi:MAG: stage III sporulation protein AF [Oscillospiraceae bacterium]